MRVGAHLECMDVYNVPQHNTVIRIDVWFLPGTATRLPPGPLQSHTAQVLMNASVAHLAATQQVAVFLYFHLTT